LAICTSEQLPLEKHKKIEKKERKTLIRRLFIITKLKNPLLMLIVLFMLQNDENSPKKKPFDYIINIYFKFQKNWIKFMMISEIEFNCFQTNFMLELFMCLRLKLLKLFCKFYSLKNKSNF
jgi:hypothetical protein